MLKKNRKISVAESIREGLIMSMKKNKNVILIGLGVDDPKGIFGTTKKIDKIFLKKKRVFDFPTAENTMTGIAIGSALSGVRPVIVHQRVEFSLLSLEQIINQAAKWYFMSGGKKSVPLVIRLIIGRGWGQGPQHSQSLETLFAHIPGLKVVCISNPKNAARADFLRPERSRQHCLFPGCARQHPFFAQSGLASIGFCLAVLGRFGRWILDPADGFFSAADAHAWRAQCAASSACSAAAFRLPAFAARSL